MTRPVPDLTIDQAQALVLDTDPWLSCEDCFDLMDGYVDELASPTGRSAPVGLVNHLAGCSACAEEVESLLALVTEDAAR